MISYLTIWKQLAEMCCIHQENEIISEVGCFIQRKLLHDIQTGSKVYSIIADESRDGANKKKMPIFIL